MPSAINAYPGQSLTPRELEILKHIARGMSNREICTTYFISESALKSDLVSAYKKLSARNRVHAVAILFRKGLIQ